MILENTYELTDCNFFQFYLRKGERGIRAECGFSEQIYIFSKSEIELLKLFEINNKDTKMTSLALSSVFVVNFKHSSQLFLVLLLLAGLKRNQFNQLISVI